MLQRIQTVYLLLAAIACVLLFFVPLAYYYSPDLGNYKLFINSVKSMDPDPKHIFGTWYTIPLFILTAISIILDLSAIFFYKKRWLQMRFAAFSGLLMIVLVMVIFFFYATKITEITKIEPEYSLFGMMLPLASLVFVVLANYAIRKDEALVKSADRLR
ncbi:MAG: DUF4293 domain-containing protein [bacterium]